MGNSAGKESRGEQSLRHSQPHSRNEHSPTSGMGPSDRLQASMYTSGGRRGSRPDLSMFGLTIRDGEQPGPETRRETKAEREARKLAKEREQRLIERERSLKEEGIDGGYLVTLGVYTGPEDFSKPMVRQLMIERKIAPFWRGLNDHSDSWVEHQYVAAARGLPIPPADEPPAESPIEPSPQNSSINLNHLTVPISARSQSTQSERSMNLSPSHPAFSLPPPTSPIGQSPSSAPFFRGRAKTLAALSSSKNNTSQTELAPQEINLPKDPYVNGTRVEAFLYKDASECPICFMYYPPYLNKTRCCDQAICSECFVQIKRPDPHPPEHHDDPDNPSPPAEETLETSVNLVSEPAACPYCAQPEFGVTYEPPPFRRGLAYAGMHGQSVTSAMSSTSSLQSGIASPGGNRRRATSLSTSAPGVITTDRVRPDWAKKLSDARAHAMRRAAAATALHNAAYVLGNQGSEGSRFGRRRRQIFIGESPNSSGRGTPRHGEGSGGLPGAYLVPINRDGERIDEQPDIFQRSSSRRRVEDIEELMMMEAIRLSLAAEEERKKKEEKEAAKVAKKEDKKKAKEAKKAAKEARKGGLSFGSSSAMASRTSLGNVGKGKEVDRSEHVPPLPLQSSPKDAQQHLEDSRARLEDQVPDSPFGASVFGALGESSHRQLLREVSNNSSSASSIDESQIGSSSHIDGVRASAATLATSPSASGLNIPSSVAEDSDTSALPTPSPLSSTEPMLNFNSLAASITADKDDASAGTTHIERIPEESTQHDTPKLSVTDTSLQPSKLNEKGDHQADEYLPQKTKEDEISPAVQSVESGTNTSFDHKAIGDVSISNSPHPVTQ